ncbi:MAG TPA: hypothetical protein VGE66_02815 [Chitinophagaceae bacterium]
MADKQRGTGAPGNSQDRPRGQGSSEQGNHSKSSDNNRSQQIKDNNKSTTKNDQSSHGRAETNR